MAETETKAQFFSVKAPLMPPGGYKRMPMVRTDHVNVVVTSYTKDGEDRIHTHPNEDHVFFVLKGAIIIVEPDGKETRVGPYEGVLMPAGHYYSFVTEGDEPAVMLRFGGFTDDRRALPRLTDDREDLEQKQRDPAALQPIPGSFFP
jgi:mannose-6-phosphate isomerase-like protein (cupin superfamily)